MVSPKAEPVSGPLLKGVRGYNDTLIVLNRSKTLVKRPVRVRAEGETVGGGSLFLVSAKAARCGACTMVAPEEATVSV
jgi:hypothetical protein